jgi:Uncharacterized alpha/beta hydrolase domain (DUF2235)
MPDAADDLTGDREERGERPPVALKGSRFVPALLVGIALLLFLANRIEWSERVLEGTAPTFSSRGTDFRNFDALVARLTAPADTDRVSRFLWQELADSTRSALLSTTTSPPRRAREAMLAQDLNRILESGYSIYTPERFPPDPQWKAGFRATTTLAPTDSQTVVISRHEGRTRLTVVNFPGQYIEYDEDDLLGSAAERDALRERIERALEPGVTPDEWGALGRDIIAQLSYTGLSTPIDEEYATRQRGGADFRWLNRLLLEEAYREEIAPKLAPATSARDAAQGWWRVIVEVRGYIGTASMAVSRWIADDVPKVVRFQLGTLWLLALFSIIPGLAGLIFRRSFGRWFLTAFAILFAVNWAAFALGLGGVSADLAREFKNPHSFYLWIEAGLLMVVVIFRLQRHSAAVSSVEMRRRNVVLALLLVAAALTLVFGMWARRSPDVFSAAGATLLLVMARALFASSGEAASGEGGKNIVLCLDGTWNEPGTKDVGHLAETNVYKLFRMLKGEAQRNDRVRGHFHARQSKEFRDEVGVRRQIAFYYHGVGNAMENSALGQAMGGAFGVGAAAIVERAYLDVVRVYRPGDRIFIFGFSRGAAIARMLAGEIGKRDVPRSLWTLRLFGRHFTLWKSSHRIDPHAATTVAVLGCWDTVGAFGLSKNILGIPFQRINLLHDLEVSLCVKRAYHMVALDETRDSFEPTLMPADPTDQRRIVEVWFSGNHSNVGGGYSTGKLADLTLDFLLQQVSSGYAWRDGMLPGGSGGARWGLYLSAARKGVDAAPGTPRLDPDPRGQLRYATGAVYAHRPRRLPIDAVIHDSVFERMQLALPVYAPKSLFALNDDLVRMRDEVEAAVQQLAETGAVEAKEQQALVERSRRHLGIMKWSAYLDATQMDGVPLRALIDPATELRHTA